MYILLYEKKTIYLYQISTSKVTYYRYLLTVLKFTPSLSAILWIDRCSSLRSLWIWSYICFRCSALYSFSVITPLHWLWYEGRVFNQKLLHSCFRFRCTLVSENAVFLLPILLHSRFRFHCIFYFRLHPASTTPSRSLSTLPPNPSA